MKAVFDTFSLLEAMAREGNPASASDSGVGAIAAEAAVAGAFLNVRINAAGLADKARAQALVDEAARIAADAAQRRIEILNIVNSHINI